MPQKLSLKQINSFFVWSVYECLSGEEVRRWGDYMLSQVDEYIDVYADIAMHSGSQAEAADLIPMIYCDEWFESEDEVDALDGIACKRGFKLYEKSCDEALKALEKHPHVEKYFREVFPFIRI